MAAAALKAGPRVQPDRAIQKLLGRYDHVTLLPNRLQFLADFKRLRGRSGRDRMLVLITLAEAKHYNEILRALGHAFAEDFVRAGLARIRAQLPGDVAIYHVSVLSFAFVLADTAPDRVPPLVSAIPRAFASDMLVEGIPVRSAVGVGLLPIDSKTLDPAETLRAALVAAQDSRRGDVGISFYNHRSDAAHRRAFQLLADLPAALDHSDQLSLVYQPRVDLSTGRCRSVEALLRWRHPTLGAISPAEFIPLVEQTSLIHPLTEWIVDRAVAQARAFLDIGRDIGVSINVSPRNLSEPGFDDRLLWVCDCQGLEPRQLEIEFTEGVLAANPERAIRQLDRLRGQGVTVAIDDFGSGFSNLAYLSQLPADILKIDQSFIRSLVPGRDFLVRQILELARGLNLRVCAEGIETPDIYDHLVRLGCDEGQGYAIARPMTFLDTMSWISAR